MNFQQIKEALGFFEDRFELEVSKDPVCVTGRPSFIAFERGSLLNLFAFNDKANRVGYRQTKCDATREPIAEENIRSIKFFQDIFVMCAYEFFQSNKSNGFQSEEALILELYTAMNEQQRATALEALTLLGTNQAAILLKREKDNRGTGLLECEVHKLETWGIPDLAILAAVQKREKKGSDPHPTGKDEEEEDEEAIFERVLRESALDPLGRRHQPDDEDAELERALELSRLESEARGLGRWNYHPNDDDDDDDYNGQHRGGPAALHAAGVYRNANAASASAAAAAVSHGGPSRSYTTASTSNNNNNGDQRAAASNGLSVHEKLRMDAAVLAAIALQRKNSNTPKFFVYDDGKIQLADRAPEGHYAANCHFGTQLHEQNQQIFYKPGGQAADELFGHYGFVHRLVKPLAEASTKRFENMFRVSSARIQAGASCGLASSSASAAAASPVVVFSPAVRGRSVQDKLKVDAPVLSALALERKNSRTPKFYVFESGQIILTGQRPPNYYSAICHLGTEPHEQNQEIFYMPAGPQCDPASQLFGHHGFVHRLAKPFPNAATNEKFMKLYETAAVPLRRNSVIDRQEYAAAFN